MADLDWIGRPPERPYWADDGQTVYYFQKRLGEEDRDLIQTDLAGRIIRTIAPRDRGGADQPQGDWNRSRTHKVYEYGGDLFVRELATGRVTQLTRTADVEADPHFMADQRRIMFRRNDTIFIRDLQSGAELQPAVLRLSKDPNADAEQEPTEYLARQQRRLFEHVRQQDARDRFQRQRQREEEAADPTRTPPPWYLGDDIEIHQSSLSPSGLWLVLTAAPRSSNELRRDQLPHFVTDSGYVTTSIARPKVGTRQTVGEQLWLLDLVHHVKYELDIGVLPRVRDDPLAALRKAAASKPSSTAPTDAVTKDGDSTAASAAAASAPAKAAEPRPIAITDLLWASDGRRLAVQCCSLDRKDRWIAFVDLDSHKLLPVEHWRDPAWINRRFSAAGWLADNRTLYFLSEETGYSQLYVRDVQTGRRRELMCGEYEVSDVRPGHDGQWMYFSANLHDPGTYETWRVRVEDGYLEQLTALRGMNEWVLSPDASRLLVIHSTTTRPAELFAQSVFPHSYDGPAPADVAQLTHTVSDDFTALPWVEPQIVAIPGRAGRPTYARLYAPKAPVERPGSAPEPHALPRPAVLFIHGAGYMQDAHAGWSYYAREFMFHTLLVRCGYVVLDMDYRASAGYGRDWRTAIYRRMGEPELDDLEDGVAWLVAHCSVDRARVGAYGGSYGGFLVLMAMFKRPDLLACGAALRPVTDWAHYSEDYTANILNTPQIDPEAYERSSPIEFVAGLRRPLLICHGMQDDNVFFQDSVQLVQRLIELKKEDWEIAIYPVESHSFREPSSWLDEYRRILRLFENRLRLPGGADATRGTPR